MSSKASLERSTTSPAITVTSWEETNKGLDELTHGSHIRHPNSIDHLSHTSGNTIGKYQTQVSETRTIKEDTETVENVSDHIKKSKSLTESNHRKHIKFPDSLNNSVSPTRQVEDSKTSRIIRDGNLSETIENEDSLEGNVTSDKISVDKDSLIDSSEQPSNRNVESNRLNNGEGYFDSISGQDEYTITESEERKQEQLPKKKLILPTSISFNDSFSSDTSQLNTSLDVSIDSVTNPSGIRKVENGATLDSLEHQIKDVNPVLNRIQNERMQSNASFEMHSHNNHPTFTMQQQNNTITHPSAGSHFASHGTNVSNKQVNHPQNNILDPSLGHNKPISTSLASPNQYANVPRPILSNTSYLFGKTAMPYLGYGHNLHLYNISGNNNIDGTPHNNRGNKHYQQHPYNPTPFAQNRSPSMTRSQSHPVASQQQQIHGQALPTSDPNHEGLSAMTSANKDGLQNRPIHHLNPQGHPLAQTSNSPTLQQNQSVVKMAAEKMKRKFLGWN